MLTIPYADRDFAAIFSDIKSIIETLEPRASVDFNSANVESIIAKVVAGCVDTLSYNQDANILEAFPSTAKDARSVFDLLSIVGYTPKTAQCCKVYLSLWDPSFSGGRFYNPFTTLYIDGYTFYNPDTFFCAQGTVTSTEWYQGNLISPSIRDIDATNFLDKYYPNLGINAIKQGQYRLPEGHVNIDSRTIRIYTEDGRSLDFVENPYLTYTKPMSFSLIPSVNSSGYSLVFSEDISSGSVTNNLYYFYIESQGYNVSTGLTPDFKGFNNIVPSFSYNYTVENSKEPETANEARKNIAYEFGWRDTPKAIITKYDAERAVLQNFDFVAAALVRDGNDYSKCNPNLLDVKIFVKLTDSAAQNISEGIAESYVNRLMTHIAKFKSLPLQYTINIADNITAENPIKLYYWYPKINIYLKKQVNAKEASSILLEVHNALSERYSANNVDFNEVPKVVDIIDTVQNASDIILYLDVDGIVYTDGEDNIVEKTDITCSFSETVNITNDSSYNIVLNTQNNTRPIMYHSLKIVDINNVVLGVDNGDGQILPQTNNLNDTSSIDYTNGELNLEFQSLPSGAEFYIQYKQETPTYCKLVNNNEIKIALESIKN